jgi:hypothetical protein
LLAAASLACVITSGTAAVRATAIAIVVRPANRPRRLCCIFVSGVSSCCDQAMAQVAPLRLNAVGAAVFPVWLAWKPMVTEVFGAITAL